MHETYNSSNENEYGNIIKAENQILYQVKQIFRSLITEWTFGTNRLNYNIT